MTGFDWDALFIWDLSWFTCLSFSWATYLTGILEITAGGLDFLNISDRDINASLCVFNCLNSVISGAGLCSEYIKYCTA